MSDRKGPLTVDGSAVLKLAFQTTNGLVKTTSITVSALALGFAQEMVANGFEEYAQRTPELNIEDANAEFTAVVEAGRRLYKEYAVSGTLAGVEFECAIPAPDTPFARPKVN